MKKFKSILPTVCYTALLLAIALLSFLIAGKTSDSPSVAKERQDTEGATIETVEEKPDSSEQPLPLVYCDEFPRKSADGEQKIYGEGNIVLVGALQTSIGNFLFLTSDCKNGDISSQEPCLAVVKTNENSDLIDTATFGLQERFLDAQITPIGIVVISADQNETFSIVRILQYDLSLQSEYKIALPSEVRILPTENSFLIFADYPDECLLYRYAEKKLLFQSIERGNLVQLFEYEDHYMIFINGNENGSFVLSLDKNTLDTKNKTVLSPDNLLAVKPQGSNTFITIEKGKTITVKKYNIATLSCTESKRIGNLDIDRVYSTQNSFILTANGAYVGEINTRGETTFHTPSNGDPAEKATVLDFSETLGKTIILLKDGDNMTFLSDTRKLESATSGTIFISSKNTFLLYLQTEDEAGYQYVKLLSLPIEPINE